MYFDETFLLQESLDEYEHRINHHHHQHRFIAVWATPGYAYMITQTVDFIANGDGQYSVG